MPCLFSQVGSTPGVTKGMQEIHLDKHIRLLDSPGIVFASGEGAAAAALRNAIKVCDAPVAQVLDTSKAALAAAVAAVRLLCSACGSRQVTPVLVGCFLTVTLRDVHISVVRTPASFNDYQHPFIDRLTLRLVLWSD